MLVYTYTGIYFFQFQTVKIVVLSKPEPRIIKSDYGQNGRTTKYFVDVIICEDATRHKVSIYKRELAEKLKVEKCCKTLKCTHHQMYGYEMKGDSVACFLEPIYKIRFINIQYAKADPTPAGALPHPRLKNFKGLFWKILFCILYSHYKSIMYM